MNTCKDCVHYVICQNNAFKEARLSGKTETVIVSIKHNIACKFFENSADFVKVVRCKDCCYSNYDKDLDDCSVCHFGVGRSTSADHYCGYGERRVEDEFKEN